MRNALLESAIDHFGRCGFEGASTRAIAGDCGTAMSSITYHFGGKEGLYLAVADHIAAQIAEEQAPVLAALGALLRSVVAPIVLVVTASAHRRAAFEAADFLMDYLKTRAPFWKKEHGPDGARWIEPTDRDRTDARRWD